MDFFNEYIVKKKKSANDMLMTTGYILAGVILSIASFFFIEFIGSFFLLIIFGAWYGVYYMLGTLNVEFEYIVTNGDLDVDKIMARRKRKRLLSVSSKDFEFFAPVHQDYKREYENSSLTRIDAAISPDSKGLYFAIFNLNSKRTVLFFNPTERMIDDFSRHVPRSAFHKGV